MLTRVMDLRAYGQIQSPKSITSIYAIFSGNNIALFK